MYGSADLEGGQEGGFRDGSFAFSEKSIRQGFMRKVYGILMAQLLITFGIISLFVYNEDVRTYSTDHPEMFIVAIVMTFIVMIVMACFIETRRRWPLNIILLMIFTVCEGFLLGSVASYCDAEAVAIAVGVTAAVCLAVTIFALQTRWDFTIFRSLLFTLLVCLILFGIVAGSMPHNVANAAYSCLGAFLFSAYLVVDTQLMMGGRHRIAISPEEYIFAALNLYLDIVQIFLYILQIVQGSRN